MKELELLESYMYVKICLKTLIDMIKCFHDITNCDEKD
jgi:hypothetical protein